MTRAHPRRSAWRSGGRDRLVRPYALTAGRTRPSGGTIDLIALVSAVPGMTDAGLAPEVMAELGPEHLRLLRFCRSSQSVADLATELDVPLGVVRILLADLRERGLVSISQPGRAGFNNVRILKEVADALRRL